MQVIRRLAAAFTVHIEHVLREFNKAPDALANQAMDAHQSLGYNPLSYLPPDEEILAAPTPKSAPKLVNGVEVKPVVRKKATKPAPQQPDLFGDF